MKLKIIAAAGLAFALSGSAFAAASITGRWITKDKDAIVEISQCGATICGRVSKYLVTPPQGIDQRDVNNPDAKLRTRRILGMAVVFGLKEDGDQWRGSIYDPKSGKTYRSVVYRMKNGNLNVKGCVGPLCRSQIWTPGR
jgi:uncharacterized protein (DUF2147 family)